MNDCIFCKIGAGQLKASVVYEDPQVLAFRDVNPQAPVHILLIPKKHVARISEITDEDWPLVAHLQRAAVLVAKKEGLTEKGFRLVTNDGADSGQTVPHLHYHVLGGRRLSWPPG